MKLKNIILLMSVIGVFFSCNTEEVIEKPTPPDVNEEMIVDLTLKANDILTKADDEPKTEPATLDEKKISNCWVLVYVENVLHSFKYFNETELLEALGVLEHPEDGVYSLKEVSASYGKTNKFVVIANSTKTDYSSYTNYTTGGLSENSLTANAFEENNGNTFNPENLVKYGELDVLMNSIQSIQVPLTQLAAKIVLKMRLDVEGLGEIDMEGEMISEGWRYKAADFRGKSWRDIQNSTDYIKYSGRTGNSPVPSGGITVEGTKYSRNTTGTPRAIKISNQYEEVWEYGSSYAYSINKISISGIETKSKMVLDGTTNPEGTLVTLTYEDIEDGTASITFYSYQKELTTEKPLAVEMVGNLVSTPIKQVTKITKKITEWAFYKTGGTSSTTIGSWETNQSNRYVYGTEDNTESTESKENDPIYPDGTEEVAVESNYKFNITPPNGILHGNYYDVTAKITALGVEPILEYAVVPWNIEEIDIPTFE